MFLVLAVAALWQASEPKPGPVSVGGISIGMALEEMSDCAVADAAEEGFVGYCLLCGDPTLEPGDCPVDGRGDVVGAILYERSAHLVFGPQLEIDGVVVASRGQSRAELEKCLNSNFRLKDPDKGLYFETEDGLHVGFFLDDGKLDQVMLSSSREYFLGKLASQPGDL